MIRPHLAGYAALVGVLTRDHHFRLNKTDFLVGLDALAGLMIEHAERRRDLAHTEADARAMARDDDDVDTTPIQYGPPHGGW
jgi:hypothetical protein